MLLGIKQVLINIDEDKYEHICQKVRKAKNEDRYVHYEWEIIANGIVLPKGHGRLIDVSNLLKVRIKKDIGLIMTLILFLFVIVVSLFRQHDIGRWEFVFHFNCMVNSVFHKGNASGKGARGRHYSNSR